MAKFLILIFLLANQIAAAQHKITRLSDLAYHLKYDCRGEGWAISDTTHAFPFDLSLENYGHLKQLKGSSVGYCNCPVMPTLYTPCHYLYLDSIRGEVDIITDFPEKINFNDVFALIQKDSFWLYNRHCGIELITTRIGHEAKMWKMNAMSKIAFAHELAEILLPKSSINTRRFVVALALSPSTAYYEDFGEKKWRDINIGFGVVSHNNSNQIYITTLSKIKPRIPYNINNSDSLKDLCILDKYAKRRSLPFLAEPYTLAYALNYLDDSSIYYSGYLDSDFTPRFHNIFVNFWANKDITYEDMLFSGQIIPSFPDMNYTEHTVKMKFRDSSYTIRYKASASLAKHLTYMPHTDNYYNYAAYPLSAPCEKSLKEAFLPILKTLENEDAQREFIKAFCVRFIKITDGYEVAGIFPEELLHFGSANADNDAIGILYTKLCHILLKNKAYHIPISLKGETLNKYETIIRLRIQEGWKDVFRNY